MSRISFASAHVWRCRLTHYIAASVKLAQPTPHRSINRARYGCITRRPTAHRTRSIIRLIQKWLRAGVLEEEVVTVSDRGTGQGSVVSPLLANVYLHYAFDLWAARWRPPEATGDVIIVRYADDSVPRMH